VVKLLTVCSALSVEKSTWTSQGACQFPNGPPNVCSGVSFTGFPSPCHPTAAPELPWSSSTAGLYLVLHAINCTRGWF